MNSRGVGSEAESTLYTHYPDSTSAGYSPSAEYPPVKEIFEPDGSWRYYASYDSQGRPTLVYSGLDTTLTNTASLCTSTEYYYSPVDSADNGTVMPRTARKEISYYKGNAISLTYRIITSTERREIYCPSTSAAYDVSTNLVTITRYYSSGDNAGREQSVEFPDGTMTFYAYSVSGGQRTVTVSTGEPNSGKTAVLNGTQTVTVTGSAGEMVSQTVKRISGEALGLTLSEDTYSDNDSYQRPQRVTHLDGTYEDTFYACCGVGSIYDRDGVQTQFTYDSEGRVTKATRLSIITTNIVDAFGQTVELRRLGTDGSSVVLRKAAFDSLGNVTNEVNAFGGTNRYTKSFNGSGLLEKTTTYPDAGTRVETFLQDGSLLKVTGTAVNPVRYVYGFESTTNVETGIHSWYYSKEIKLQANGDDSSEWVKTYTDSLGRPAKVAYPDGAYSLSLYNSKGQLVRKIDPDKVSTLYQYDGEGKVEYTAVDVNQDGVIDFGGLDRVTQTVRDVTTVNSINVQRTRTYVLPTDNSSTTLLTREACVSTDGLKCWATAFGQTKQEVTVVNTATGSRTNTITLPDGSTTVSIFSFGRLQTVTRYTSSGTQISKLTYSYDPHGRIASILDARTGTTTYRYGAGDLETEVDTPTPGNGTASLITYFEYDTSGRLKKTTQPDGTVVNNDYFPTGQLQKTYGSRTYPIEYTYDPAGRMKTMKTWQNFSGNSGTAVTTWNYHSTRGWMSSKDYADASTGAAGSVGDDYTYTSGGRLTLHYRAREHTTGVRSYVQFKYGFNDSTTNNSHADVTSVGYGDGGVMPTVTHSYDRRGQRLTSAIGGSGLLTTYSYNDAGQLLGEKYSNGTLNGLNVTNTYDSYGRRSTVGFRNGTNILGSSTYGYDNASRLSSVTDGTYSANYTYVGNSSLVDTVLFKTNSTTRLTTKRQYDRLNRLQSIVSTPSAADQALSSYIYQYNSASQRTRMTMGDGSYWAYDYDSLGQVKVAKHYWADGTAVAGQQFEYGFDDIGNRTSSKRGGDDGGGNLRETTYARNYLNQYSNRTNMSQRYADVLGLANYDQSAPGNVTVNGQTAYRKGEYWRTELVLGTGGASWQSVTVSTSTSTNTGNLFVSPTPETYTYDADGNLTADGRWNYTWDTENRLIAVESLSGNPSDSKRKLTFEYDALGRRIGKKVYVWDGSSYPSTPNTTLKFLYDGWNLLAELDATNGVVRSYQWGVDESGSLQGAGGVGGLVSMKSGSGVAQFAAFDGNGNVAALVDASSGAITANYEYGPFGEVVRASGSLAKVNPFRFSTIYQDDETSLLMYIHRSYSASLGRFLSRDPVAEFGFAVLNQLTDYLTSNGQVDEYEMDELDDFGRVEGDYISANEMVNADNNLITGYDVLGLKKKPKTPKLPAPKPPGPKPPGPKPPDPKPIDPKPPEPPPKPTPTVIKNVKITFYCNCKICTGKNPGDKGYGLTASGATACKGTVAADWKKMPNGSQISFTMPDGTAFNGTVQDKGGAIKGNHLDIWCSSHKDALNNGTFNVDVTVTPP